MQSRIIVVDMKNKDWLKTAYDKALFIQKKDFKPSVKALDLFDQKRSFKKKLNLLNTN